MLKTLGVHFIRHPCLTRKLRVLAPAAPKIIPRLLSGQKCSGVCQNAVVGVGASLRRLCATAIVHPCTFMNALLVSHPCLVSRLGCHIVWQLSAADFKHPCLKLWASTITHPCVCGRWGRRVPAPTLCDCYRASFARL